jgi:nitroreductase
VVLTVLFRPVTMLTYVLKPAVPEKFTDMARTMGRQSGLVSTSLAVQNLLLAAHEAGLGAACMTGPLMAREQIRRELGLQPSWDIAMLVALGHPASVPENPGRKPVDKVLKWI